MLELHKRISMEFWRRIYCKCKCCVYLSLRLRILIPWQWASNCNMRIIFRCPFTLCSYLFVVAICECLCFCFWFLVFFSLSNHINLNIDLKCIAIDMEYKYYLLICRIKNTKNNSVKKFSLNEGYISYHLSRIYVNLAVL